MAAVMVADIGGERGFRNYLTERLRMRVLFVPVIWVPSGHEALSARFQ